MSCPADVLRLVPGLVISQHQGGGKAEQYFLRGFVADHGTDIALFVDGLPVNLRSHAHGQGYADLHFLTPETLKQVDVLKGPYFVEFGDFATAGAINFVTLDTVPENLVEAAGGSFGTQRYLTLLSPTRERLKTLIAVEAYTTNGPFDRAQDYMRFNAFAKASAALGESVDASVWASYLDSNFGNRYENQTPVGNSPLISGAASTGAIDSRDGLRADRRQEGRSGAARRAPRFPAARSPSPPERTALRGPPSGTPRGGSASTPPLVVLISSPSCACQSETARGPSRSGKARAV